MCDAQTHWAAVLVSLWSVTGLWAQQAGGLRGVVYDKDFDVPLVLAQIQVVETGQKVKTGNEGHFVFAQVTPGTYTLIVSKEGYTRKVLANVVVTAGKMTEVHASLAGEFTEMEEFVVQDLQLGGGSELGLLNLRINSPSIMSGVSSEIMSQAGVSDAAGALRLVSGASVQNGKYAVVRGLPDRYVNSQLNGFRLPTADADKRAVQLDQFPAALLDNIQVNKTFTPDQQGDASGGAVDVVTKGIPDKTTFSFSSEMGTNSQTTGNDDFLSYQGGGVSFWGFDDGGRGIQYENIGSNWDGAVGVSRDSAPIDYKWSMSGGGNHVLDNDVKVGGFGTFFYQRDSSYYDHSRNDRYWVLNHGDAMSPDYGSNGGPGVQDFYTSLFDLAQGSQSVKWGGLATVGLKTDKHSVSLLYMYTHTAEDKAILAENTRGKAYYFPGYNPNDPNDPGNSASTIKDSPYLRLHTLEYTERTTHTLQLKGQFTLPQPTWDIDNYLSWLEPKLESGVALSFASMDQPDKRMFGSQWTPAYVSGPSYHRTSFSAQYKAYQPTSNSNLGSLQRLWKKISENSTEFFADLKFPFKQWSDEKGYLKVGAFRDHLKRTYTQHTFSNYAVDGYNNDFTIPGSWDNYASDVFPTLNNPVSDAYKIDVDYDGDQKITAGYGMMDLPLDKSLHLIGGARWEATDMSIVNHPGADAVWVSDGQNVNFSQNPHAADRSFSQNDLLPSLELTYQATPSISMRASYSQTVARQTFKELAPVQQMEYLGGDIFVGDPNLQMSAVDNYDLRVDYSTYTGGLLSLAYFNKQIKKPIEYVQRVTTYPYITPDNYPKGKLSGWELEIRQEMGHFRDALEGLTLGGNFTWINSQVTLSSYDAGVLANLGAPMHTRDMTAAPDHLFNLFFTYDLSHLGLEGTQIGLFYTINGDTLVAGAGQSNGHFIPNVYAKEYDTLNFNLTQKIKEHWKLKFQAKNLTNPAIQTVYRSPTIGSDVVKSTYKKGMDFTLGLSYEF